MVSVGSSMIFVIIFNVYFLCGVILLQSDMSSVKLEYMDFWGYYIDYIGMQEDLGNLVGGCLISSGVFIGNGLVCYV